MTKIFLPKGPDRTADKEGGNFCSELMHNAPLTRFRPLYSFEIGLHLLVDRRLKLPAGSKLPVKIKNK